MQFLSGYQIAVNYVGTTCCLGHIYLLTPARKNQLNETIFSLSLYSKSTCDDDVTRNGALLSS